MLLRTRLGSHVHIHINVDMSASTKETRWLSRMFYKSCDVTAKLMIICLVMKDNVCITTGDLIINVGHVRTIITSEHQ